MQSMAFIGLISSVVCGMWWAKELQLMEVAEQFGVPSTVGIPEGDARRTLEKVNALVWKCRSNWQIAKFVIADTLMTASMMLTGYALGQIT